QIESDYVYEIGLTPNRSDATNHLGVAKDLAAALKINYEHEGIVNVPNVEHFQADSNDLPVEVVVEDAAACPRYVGVSIKNVTIKDSPDWLKKRLQAIGVKSISNIVDITNFVLHELGQPLHAFDLHKITDQKVIVKKLPQDTLFQSLDEVDRKLHAEDLMICDGASNGMCIAGVFGGLNSGVSDQTTAIFLESAHFNAKSIRRTSMRHNLRTDAAKVFEKGSDPNVAVFALKRAALLIKELAGGEIASDIIDLYPQPIEKAQVAVKYAHVDRLIGNHIPKEQLHSILDALEMEVLSQNDESFTVAIPTNKADVTREADVIEEILRIYGFNKVEIDNQIRSAIVIAPNPDPREIRNMASDLLSSNGFHEMMGLSLSESRYYEEVLESVQKEALVYINNTSNVQLDIMRPTMIVSGLEAVVHNQNRQQYNLKLYEFGRSYQTMESGHQEQNHLTLFLTGSQRAESWRNTAKSAADFYTLKAFVEQVLYKLGVKGYQEKGQQDEVFAFGLQYHRGPQSLVSFGKVQPTLTKAFSIRGAVYYADFNWDNLLKAIRKHKVTYEGVSKYPSTRRDLALIVDNSIKFSDIVAIARKVGKKVIKEINLFDVYENAEQLGENKKSYAVSYLFEDPNKTLKDKEVDKVMNQLIYQYENSLGAMIRR
ncbi:MAG: phenylalanine--tRNA ligase subunit beta, partial [Bacteroidota bacterium]